MKKQVVKTINERKKEKFYCGLSLNLRFVENKPKDFFSLVGRFVSSGEGKNIKGPIEDGGVQGRRGVLVGHTVKKTGKSAVKVDLLLRLQNRLDA